MAVALVLGGDSSAGLVRPTRRATRTAILRRVVNECSPAGRFRLAGTLRTCGRPGCPAPLRPTGIFRGRRSRRSCATSSCRRSSQPIEPLGRPGCGRTAGTLPRCARPRCSRPAAGRPCSVARLARPYYRRTSSTETRRRAVRPNCKKRGDRKSSVSRNSVPWVANSLRKNRATEIREFTEFFFVAFSRNSVPSVANSLRKN